MNRFRLILLAAAVAFWMTAQPAPLQAQTTVKIVSGNGQMVLCGAPLVVSIISICPAYFPMVVQVVNSAGIPQVGVSVNWAITSGAFNASLLSGTTTTTDGSGLTQNVFVYANAQGPQGGPFQQFAQSTVTAATTDALTTFTLTAAVFDASSAATGSIPPVGFTPLPYLQTLFAGTPVSGSTGSNDTQPIQIRVAGSRGLNVPNVSLQLVNLQDPSVGPTATCAENTGGPGIALSDATGIASCTVQFGGTPGHGQFYLLLGAGGTPLADPTAPPLNAFFSSPINIVETPASPGIVKIISGNSQSGAPGQALGAFVVEVDSSGGVALSGQQVRWSSLPFGAVNFSTSLTTTDITGRTSNAGTLSGTANGTIQVTATAVSDPSKSATFTMTAVPPVVITSFTMVSGNNQTTPVNSAFPQALVVQVTVSSGSAANLPIQFLVTSGSITLSSTTVSTDASGRAQVNVAAGSVTGSASVQASIATSAGSGAQNFQLTVTPAAPSITPASFVNGADQQANSLSPCSIGMILAPAGVLGVANAFPTFPGQPVTTGARITVNNVGAPILSIVNTPNGSQQAISFQVPCETAPSTAVPVGINLGGATTTVNVGVQAGSPGIFQTTGSDGVLRAVVIRPDGSFATVSNPARKGETVSVLVTGLGATSPAVGTFSLPVPGGAPANVTGTVIVGVGCCGTQVVSAKLSEDLPGVYLVTFVVPSDATAGSNITMSVAVIPQGSGTPFYSAGTKIPIQ